MYALNFVALFLLLELNFSIFPHGFGIRIPNFELLSVWVFVILLQRNALADILSFGILATFDLTDKMYTWLGATTQKKRYQLVEVWHTYTRFIAVTVVYFIFVRFVFTIRFISVGFGCRMMMVRLLLVCVFFLFVPSVRSFVRLLSKVI